MAHDVLMTVDRNTRRAALRSEAAHRKTGIWPAWRIIELPLGIPGSAPDGWNSLVKRAHVNDVFSVLERPCHGGFIHLMISSLSEIRPTWPEGMRIKDELAGPDRIAVEVYPARGNVVDAANAYHLPY